jgi:hypothetical protein
MAGSPNPQLSENGYLFGLPYEALRDLVLADQVESLALREHRWQRRGEGYHDLWDQVARCLAMANTHLSGRVARRAKQILHSVMERAQQLAEQAGQNAVAHRAAAGTLADAQRKMNALGADLPLSIRQARAAVIAYELAEVYSNLTLRVLGPPSATTGNLDDGRYDQYGLAAGLGAIAGSRLPRAALLRAPDSEPQAPADDQVTAPAALDDEGEGAYRPTIRLERDSAAPVVGLPAPMPVPRPPTGTPDAPRLVDRARLVRAAAWLVTEGILTRNTAARAELPAVVNLRVAGGHESVGLLHKLREAIAVRAHTEGPAPVPLVVATDSWSAPEDVWGALLRVAPKPAKRGRLLGYWRRGTGGTDDRRVLLRSALRTWSEQGKMPVYLVEKTHGLSGAVLDELITAVLALSSGPDAAAAFVLEIDPALACARLDEVRGQGAGSERLRRVNRLGFQLPALSPRDIDLFHTGIAQARVLPVPVWAESAELDTDGELWLTISPDLAAQGALREAQQASVVWLWRFYLRVLETAPLSRDAAIHHGQSVYALARVAVRWAQLQLELPPSAQLLPDAPGRTGPSVGPLDGTVPVGLTARDELTQLRDQLNADPGFAALVSQVL